MHSSLRGSAFYVLTLALGAAAFFVVRAFGESLVAPAPDALPPVATSAPAGTLAHVLLALVTVLVAARAVGVLFGKLRQPPVVGEIVAGILLGPSLFGRLAPDWSRVLFPPAISPHLSVLSQVGVILYMFLVGLELDGARLKDRSRTALAISHASILVPFVLGTVLALWLYPIVSTSDVRFTSFALFLGVAMSVTAFPVLARILTDRGLATTELGTLALACAAVDDVTAWCLLAFVVSVVKAQASSALVTLALTALFIAGMLFVVRPVAKRLCELVEDAPLSRTSLSLAFGALLVSALVTEAIGIHALFGAFFLGAVVPAHSRVAREVTARLEDVVVVLFLPAFFAFTGLRTELGLVSGAGDWLLCATIVVTASVGKFGGSLAAARFTGLSWREGSAMGVLMNTRGLMELVVLNVGLDLGVISPRLFAMLVVMAVVTTVATTPLVDLLTARAERAPTEAPFAQTSGSS